MALKRFRDSIWSKTTSVSRLFAGCHVLEELVLHKFVGDNTTKSDISIPTLKILSVRFATGRSNSYTRHKVKINAPVLEHINLEDNSAMEFDLEDVSSLVEANVTTSWLANRHIPLFKALCNTKVLSFHWDWYAKKSWRNFRPHSSFLNLVRLELQVGFDGWNMVSLLLEICDNLEVLVLAKNANFHGFGFDMSWKPPKYVPECLLSSLTMVYFKEFEGLPHLLKIAKYLLENGRVLKMMDISTDGDLPLDSKHDLLKELSMFTRGSNACRLQFN